MAVKTELSIIATPGRVHTFIAKAEAEYYVFATSTIHAVKGTTKISAPCGHDKIIHPYGTTKISARVN